MTPRTRMVTDAALSALLAERATGRELADGSVPGLSIRLAAGRATWSLVLRVAGAGSISRRGRKKKGPRVRMTLGQYPSLSILAARELANRYLELAVQGISPTPASESPGAAGGFTVRALADEFLSDYVHMKELRAQARYESVLKTHVLPMLGGVLADHVTREHVRAVVKHAMIHVPRGPGGRDRRRGGVEAARSAMSVLRRMMGWAIEESKISRVDNPVSGMGKNLPRKRQRERVLSLYEVRAAWHAAGSLGYPFGPVYRLIMLTGCRPGEWSTCRRSFIDLNQALLVLPASSYKSNHLHVVPLVSEALRVLEPVLATGMRGEFIFSGTRGSRPLAGWGKAHSRMLREICAETGERVRVRWTPHDLRRTVATRIAENLGAGGEQLIRRVLGHSDGSATAIYNRYGYVKEMRAVLEQWSRELLGDEQRVVIDTSTSSPQPSLIVRV